LFPSFSVLFLCFPPLFFSSERKQDRLLFSSSSLCSMKPGPLFPVMGRRERNAFSVGFGRLPLPAKQDFFERPFSGDRPPFPPSFPSRIKALPFFLPPSILDLPLDSRQTSSPPFQEKGDSPPFFSFKLPLYPLLLVDSTLPFFPSPNRMGKAPSHPLFFFFLLPACGRPTRRDDSLPFLYQRWASAFSPPPLFFFPGSPPLTVFLRVTGSENLPSPLPMEIRIAPPMRGLSLPPPPFLCEEKGTSLSFPSPPADLNRPSSSCSEPFPLFSPPEEDKPHPLPLVQSAAVPLLKKRKRDPSPSAFLSPKR